MCVCVCVCVCAYDTRRIQWTKAPGSLIVLNFFTTYTDDLFVKYIRGTFSKFRDFFLQAYKIVDDSLWNDRPIFMISCSNKQLHQELEYTLLKPDCHCWWISKIQSGREDLLEERYAITFCFKLAKNASETYGMLQTAFWPPCMNRASVFERHKRFKEGRGMIRGVGGVRKSIDQSWLVKGLGLLCWGSKVSSISTRTIHQSTTPSLSQTIRPRWAWRQFVTLPIVQTLLPVTFGYSLSSQVVVMRQLRRWKRLWRRSLTRLNKRTSMGPFRSCRNGTTSAFQPEECTINKSAYTKKVWELI